MRAKLWIPFLAIGAVALALFLARPLIQPARESARPAQPVPLAAKKVHPSWQSALLERRHTGSQLAIIIDDCGQAIGVERAMIALPIPLTFSVLPGVGYTGTVEREAVAMHQGVMLHLPMESLAHLNPGPGAVTTGMRDAQIVAQVRGDIRDVPLALGINNHEGSEASADWRVMRAVMGVAAAEHRFFIDSRTTPNTVVIRAARAAGVPNASRNVFLDNEADTAYIEDMLRRAVRISKRDGTAIAIGHPRPATLQALREMIPALEADGIHFTLASTLLHS